MKKWTLLVCTLLISSGLLAWQFGLLSSNNKSLEYVPADTIYYIGGDSAENLTKYIPSLSNSTTTKQDALLNKVLALFGEDDNDSPQRIFVSHLINKYNEYQNTVSNGTLNTPMFDMFGSFALFNDAIIPVARVEIADETIFNDVIEDAVKQSQWQYEWDDLGETKVRLWHINKSVGVDVYFALAIHQGSAVISLVTSEDDLIAKQKRFGLIKPQPSLAETGVVNDVKNRYDYDDDMVFILQLNHIVESILLPEQTHLGQDLSKYFSNRTIRMFQRNIGTRSIDDSCKIELNEIAQTIPLFSMGYQSFTANDGEAGFQFHSALEINNSDIMTELQNMQGYLAKHTTEVNDKIFVTGLGLDIDALIPGVENLIQKFAKSDFQCEGLQRVQAQLIQQDLRESLQTNEIFSGFKGIGLSVIDLPFDSKTQRPFPSDFLLTISTTKPAALLTFLQGTRHLANFNLKVGENGAPIKLDTKMLPNNIEVFSAMGDESLMLFSGEKSKQLAKQFASETITKNGLYTAGFNYRRLNELTFYPLVNEVTKNIEQAQCVNYYKALDEISKSNKEIRVNATFDEYGLQTTYLGKTGKPTAANNKITGHFTRESQDWECGWMGSGAETFNDDGTGEFIFAGPDESDQECVLYKSANSWAIEGNTLTTHIKPKFRRSCGEEFSEQKENSFTCELLNVGSDSFQCLFEIKEINQQRLSRYTRTTTEKADSAK